MNFEISSLDQFVARMSDEDRLEIVRDSIEFEKTGITGENSLLRSATTKYNFELYKTNENLYIVNRMIMMVSGCHKYYSMRYILGET